jgi:hypothetical protein
MLTLMALELPLAELNTSCEPFAVVTTFAVMPGLPVVWPLIVAAIPLRVSFGGATLTVIELLPSDNVMVPLPSS